MKNLIMSNTLVVNSDNVDDLIENAIKSVSYNSDIIEKLTKLDLKDNYVDFSEIDTVELSRMAIAESLNFDNLARDILNAVNRQVCLANVDFEQKRFYDDSVVIGAELVKDSSIKEDCVKILNVKDTLVLSISEKARGTSYAFKLLVSFEGLQHIDNDKLRTLRSVYKNGNGSLHSLIETLSLCKHRLKAFGGMGEITLDLTKINNDVDA